MSLNLCLQMNLVIFTKLFLILVTVCSAENRTQAKSGDGKRAKGFFLGNRSTTTYTDVSVVTSEVFFSCLVGTADNSVCTGRRKRSNTRLKKQDLQVSGREDAGLESSLDEPELLVPKDLPSKGGRFLGVTFWTTTRTTTTVTLLSTNSQTTLRLSYYCLAGNINLPEFNCEALGR